MTGVQSALVSYAASISGAQLALTSVSGEVLGAQIGLTGRGKTPLVLLFNAGSEDLNFELPPGHWQVELDSTQPTGQRQTDACVHAQVLVGAHSVLLLAERPTPLALVGP